MPGVRGKLGGVIVIGVFFAITPLYAETFGGVVLDSQTGFAVEDANVRLGPYYDVSDVRGVFSFVDIRPGEYKLEISHIAYSELEEQVDLREGGDISRRFELVPTVFIASGVTVTAKASPNTIIIPESSSASGLSEYIGRLPGAAVIEGGMETAISIRGSRPEDVLVVIDGVPLERNENGVCDLNSISTDDIASVEILTSDIPIEYANLAPAGVILIKTRQLTGFYTKAGTGGGSFGAYNVTASAGGRLAKILSLSVSGRHGFDLRDFEYEAGDTVAIRYNNYSKTSNLRLSLGMNFLYIKLNTDFSLVSRRDGMPGDINHPTPEAYKEGLSLRGNLIGEAFAGPSIIKTRLSMYNSDNYYFSPRPFVFSPIDANNITSGIDATLKANFPMKAVSPGFGIEYRRENYEQCNNLNSNRNIGPVDRNLSSVWVESPLDLSLFNDFNIEINPNVRWDAIDSGAFVPKGNLGSGISYMNRGFLIGASASYSEAFRLPTFGDLYWQRDAYAEGNPALLPEESYRRNGRIFTSYRNNWAYIYTSTEIFSRTIDSVIVWRRGFDGLYRPYNASREETEGREDALRVDFGDYASIDYSNTTLESIHRSQDIQLDGKWLPYRPNYLQHLGVELRYRGAALRVDGNWVGKRYFLEANTKWTEPYCTWEASISYGIDLGRIAFNPELSVYNIFNESYEILDGYPTPGTACRFALEMNYKGE